jgi:Cysteine-rich CWC
MIFAKEKRCSKCGVAFECGGMLGCWCRDLKLDRAQLDLLKQRYVDCLCPRCLGQFATAAPANSLSANTPKTR